MRKMMVKIFRSKRGESIMEALVSLLILGILMTTITSVIRFSMVMTGTSIRNAVESQDVINDLMLERLAEYDTSTGMIIFTTVDNDSFDIDASHSVTLYSEDNIIAFYPD